MLYDEAFLESKLQFQVERTLFDNYSNKNNKRVSTSSSKTLRTTNYCPPKDKKNINNCGWLLVWYIQDKTLLNSREFLQLSVLNLFRFSHVFLFTFLYYFFLFLLFLLKRRTFSFLPFFLQVCFIILSAFFNKRSIKFHELNSIWFPLKNMSKYFDKLSKFNKSLPSTYLNIVMVSNN